MQIAIIGAGASGCFAAINIKRMMPQAVVTVYESGNRALAKVAVTGGGRCNLTNSFAEVKNMDSVYPRGGRLMKKLMHWFNHNDTCKWFEANGVKLTTQDDQCVFPASQNAMEIVSTLLRMMNREEVALKTTHRVASITPSCNEDGDTGDPPTRNGYLISFSDSTNKPAFADIVVVATGGSPRRNGLSFLNSLNLKFVEPVPSLFSLCLDDNTLKKLTGTVIKNATVSLTGTKFRASGALLITHWGVSGPAILKLSSYAARHLYENGYKATISINWTGDKKENDMAGYLGETAVRNPQKQLQSIYPTYLNSRLWTYIICGCGLNPEIRWADLGRKSYNKLASALTNTVLTVNGKNRFKDEFVTCGGVALDNINPSTLECRNHPGIFFTGEVLDIDAITGGFNLQAAWTTGYIAATAISGR
ncbi:NAD(P)/FAD-dependent oxidoreductase [Xylanibacter muris]|uniref:NAD(P)/FAD-dependent oxidoreductase n=1 Tax=Xylanibacter muris TaxID=2736290 RepID=A0ABX2AQ06_9BACT|nr:NAD(P)/FAD-dependent oxidoreductase [Xylanibacter muris]NPD92820.1 NAD(P)/FAD-dependent oxidoreductase [Xylanibacter muris]